MFECLILRFAFMNSVILIIIMFIKIFIRGTTHELILILSIINKNKSFQQKMKKYENFAELKIKVGFYFSYQKK